MSALLLPGAKKELLADVVDILNILPLKVRLAEDGGCLSGNGTSSDSDADNSSSIDEDLAAQPRFVKAPEWTTVMMQNIPCSYMCDTLIDLLESMGFSKWFDFVYVPIKRTEEIGVGYGFVNLTSTERAEEFMLAFEGFDGWASSSSKPVCSMKWSICQGLSENISRYRNSPFMRDGVPAIYKPVLLEDGVRVPFPEPTKALKQDRSQRYR